MIGRKKRSGGAPSEGEEDNVPATMMALAKALQLETGSAELQALVELIAVSASEDPQATATSLGRSPAALRVAMRDPSPEEGAAAKFLTMVAAFAGDALEPD